MLARLISNINCKTETNCSCSVTNKSCRHHSTTLSSDHQGEMSLLAEQHNIWVTLGHSQGLKDKSCQGVFYNYISILRRRQRNNTTSIIVNIKPATALLELSESHFQFSFWRSGFLAEREGQEDRHGSHSVDDLMLFSFSFSPEAPYFHCYHPFQSSWSSYPAQADSLFVWSEKSILFDLLPVVSLDVLE